QSLEKSLIPNCRATSACGEGRSNIRSNIVDNKLNLKITACDISHLLLCTYKSHQFQLVIYWLDKMVGLPGVGDTIQRIDTMAKIPDGAIILRDEDVLKYQMSRLVKWKPKSEVWPLTWGSSILAGCAAFSGCLLHFHYRTKWLLGPKGRGAYFPAALIPAALNSLLHENIVVRDILMGRLKCPTCAELHSAGLHTIISVFFPLAVTHLYNDIKRRETQNEIPAKRLLKFLRTPKQTKNLLLPLFIVQFAAGMFMARYEGHTYYTVLMRPDYASQE
ncbi:hypothetical protein CHS0354_022260, partial [Potamilus streckersoni]